MARMRTIKPETFQSYPVTLLPFRARWTWVGLWTYCDDEGRGKDDPRLIKASLYPLEDDVSHHDVDADLHTLVNAGRVCRYIGDDGRRYLHVVNFAEHQRPQKPVASKLPACGKDCHGGPDSGCPCPDCVLLDPPSDSATVGLPEPYGPVVSSSSSSSSSSSRGRGRGDTYGAGEKSAGSAQLAIINGSAEKPTIRAQRLTRAYTDQIKISNFSAIMQLVRKAMNADHTDQAITDALGRLAADGRPVTADTLRIELDGLPAPRAPTRRPGTADQRMNDALHYADKYEAEGR